MHTVVLSPHLDDAVLSTGCFIAEEVDRGGDVTVLTVFSHCADDADAADEYRARRREDETAVSSLGAAVDHMGLPDAPFRGRYYTTFERIVSAWRETDDDPSDLS